MNDHDDWFRDPNRGESKAEATWTGILMLALICVSIVCLAMIHP